MQSFWRKFYKDRIKPIFYMQTILLVFLTIFFVKAFINPNLNYYWLFYSIMGMVSLLTGIEIYILRKKDYIPVFIIAAVWLGVGIFEFYK